MYLCETFQLADPLHRAVWRWRRADLRDAEVGGALPGAEPRGAAEGAGGDRGGRRAGQARRALRQAQPALRARTGES